MGSFEISLSVLFFIALKGRYEYVMGGWLVIMVEEFEYITKESTFGMLIQFFIQMKELLVLCFG